MAKRIIDEAAVPVRIQDIKMVDVDELLPNPDNPNQHTEVQIDRLVKILKYQGWRLPIKVSTSTGMISSGHGRLLAAKKMGLKKVPVSYQDYDDYDQEFADVVSDNAIASWSHLDYKAVNEKLGSFDPSFDIDFLGIENFKLDVSEKLNSTAETGHFALDFTQNSGIKQIIMAFQQEEYQKILPLVKLAMEKSGHETVKDLFADLVMGYVETAE